MNGVHWVSTEQQVGERTPLRLHFTQAPRGDGDSVAAIFTPPAPLPELRHSSLKRERGGESALVNFCCIVSEESS